VRDKPAILQQDVGEKVVTRGQSQMNFEVYEKEGHQLYAQFAAVISSIISVVLRGSPEIRVQQIQERAKSPESLRNKLVSIGRLGTDDIQSAVKDLAGCRAAE
jgi:ppGpp synthetase/RelA/SpoT-type nucleotidyltranferase